jgi:hypothetical protein
MASESQSVSDEAYERWYREVGGVDPDSLTEENLVALFSNTLRETSPEAQARGYVDIANMALAMADRTLGSQVPVAKCLIFDLH